MKRTTVISMFIFAAISATAQPGPMPPENMDNESFLRMQSADLADMMYLDSKTEEKFVKEYMAFRKEIDDVAKEALPSQNAISESDIDKAIRQNFEVSEKVIDIRKEYYKRFKKFLKPSQIQTMYRFENEAARRMVHGPGAPDGPGMPDGPKGPRPF